VNKLGWVGTGIRMRLTLPPFDEAADLVVDVGTADSASVLSSESPIVCVCVCFVSKPINSPGCLLFCGSYSKTNKNYDRKLLGVRRNETAKRWRAFMEIS